jgi:hypothetical protein
MLKLPQPIKNIFEGGYSKRMYRQDMPEGIQGVSRIQMLDNAVDDFTLVNFVWSTSQESSNEINAGNEIGFIMYDATGGQEINKVVRLDFFKPVDTTFKFVSLQTVFGNAIHPTTGETQVDDVTIYLNPTKTKITAGTLDYYRFSNGTTIRSSYSPTADGETITDTFTESQIKQIKDGWNYLVIQQNTSAANPGLAAMSLVVTGYVQGSK